MEITRRVVFLQHHKCLFFHVLLILSDVKSRSWRVQADLCLKFTKLARVSENCVLKFCGAIASR